MLISHIKIANHSRIADLDLEVRGHAVIVGANDVGKTSILRLLDFLLGATTGQLYQRLGLADLADPSVELLVEAILTDFTDEERRLFPREVSIDPGDRSESLQVRLTAAADPDDSEAVTIRRWFPEAGHDRPPSREQVAAFGWRFLPATRGTAATALDGERSVLHALLMAIDLGTETAELAAAERAPPPHLEAGGEKLDFLGFHHRLVRSKGMTGKRGGGVPGPMTLGQGNAARS